MSELNSLINQLYAEHTAAMQETQQAAAQPTCAQATESDSLRPEVQRLADTYTQMLRVLGQDGHRHTTTDSGCATADAEGDIQRIVMEWEGLTKAIDGIRQHVELLEQDIRRMQPWGDFDVSKVSKLRSWGYDIRFWTMSSKLLTDTLADTVPLDWQLLTVADDGQTAHFVTIGALPEQALPEQAREVTLCPSPISTLIMLQTRDRDSLCKLDTLQGDFALSHIEQVATHLRQILPADTPLPSVPRASSVSERLRRFFSPSRHNY